jgi:hypothetical protein
MWSQSPNQTGPNIPIGTTVVPSLLSRCLVVVLCVHGDAAWSTVVDLWSWHAEDVESTCTMLLYCYLSLVTKSENSTDIFQPYSRSNSFRKVQICAYPSPDIQHPILYPYPNIQIAYLWCRLSNYILSDIADTNPNLSRHMKTNVKYQWYMSPRLHPYSSHSMPVDASITRFQAFEHCNPWRMFYLYYIGLSLIFYVFDNHPSNLVTSSPSMVARHVVPNHPYAEETQKDAFNCNFKLN